VNGEQIVEFSPDGGHAAMAGREGRVLVLDLHAGEAIRAPVRGHNDFISSLTYSPDGRRILTGGGDSHLALWAGETGLLLARVPVPQGAMVAAFGDDPDTVLSVDTGMGPVYEWDTDVTHALDFACRVAGRAFTEAEWSAQFGTRPYQEICPNG
jgi:WD40 repeat protein